MLHFFIIFIRFRENGFLPFDFYIYPDDNVISMENALFGTPKKLQIVTKTLIEMKSVVSFTI